MEKKTGKKTDTNALRKAQRTAGKCMNLMSYFNKPKVKVDESLITLDSSNLKENEINKENDKDNVSEVLNKNSNLESISQKEEIKEETSLKKESKNESKNESNCNSNSQSKTELDLKLEKTSSKKKYDDEMDEDEQKVQQIILDQDRNEYNSTKNIEDWFNSNKMERKKD